MARVTLYIALFGVATLVVLFSTLYVVRYDQRAPTVAMIDLLPHETGAQRMSPSEPPASFDARWHLGG